MNFIQQSPRNIQYILTSRNEEQCEYKINLKGFGEENNGLDFIEEYSNLMDFDIEHISKEEKKQLLYESQGNTLIILLALERISSKKKKYYRSNSGIKYSLYWKYRSNSRIYV